MSSMIALLSLSSKTKAYCYCYIKH